MCKVEVLQGGVCLERPLGVGGEEGVRDQGRHKVVIQLCWVTCKEEYISANGLEGTIKPALTHSWAKAGVPWLTCVKTS